MTQNLIQRNVHEVSSLSPYFCVPDNLVYSVSLWWLDQIHTKLAQGVLRRVYNCTFVEVDEVNDTVRGEDGFGSTGTTINTK